LRAAGRERASRFACPRTIFSGTSITAVTHDCLHERIPVKAVAEDPGLGDSGGGARDRPHQGDLAQAVGAPPGFCTRGLRS